MSRLTYFECAHLIWADGLFITGTGPGEGQQELLAFGPFLTQIAIFFTDAKTHVYKQTL